MSKKYQTFPGMEDILPGEVEKWQWLERQTRVFYETGGFSEIRTPILEPTELFSRSIGETSDIVHKEMYTFQDRGERNMTMRPEMTASVARSVIQHSLFRSGKALKLYYIGPMFRAERPQAGRKRQFHQIGVEIVGEANIESADFVIIKQLYDFLKFVGIKSPKFRLNDLSKIAGAEAETVRGKLRDYFEPHKASLDKDSLYRLDKNVLRIFDSKNPDMQSMLDATPWDEIAELSPDFKKLCSLLDDEGIPYEVNRRLVRGLDYYTGVVFEVAADGLGAQDALAGGGRYDKLYEELGGGKVPCTGFSIGMERLQMVLNPTVSHVYIAPLDASPATQEYAVQAGLALNQHGVCAKVYGQETSLSKHLKKANKANCQYVLIVGEDDLKKKTYTLKDLNEKDKQEEFKLNDLITYLSLKD